MPDNNIFWTTDDFLTKSFLIYGSLGDKSNKENYIPDEAKRLK